MKCIYCNNQITNRKKGDHVIPQGLGKFSPEITVFHICRECDSKHGNDFERIALRTGMLATFRAIKGIKSRNNKKQPIHSPSLDKFSALESKEFAISNMSQPDQTVYVGYDGLLRSANKILIRINDNLTKSIEIPPTRNIREICNFIEENIPQKLNDIVFELQICKDQLEDVLNELRRRSRKIGETYNLDQQPEFTIVKISSIVTENHFRFVASTVLKAMIFLEYSIDILHPLIDYVRTGDTRELNYFYVDERESSMDTLDDPPLNLFYHTFAWNISKNSMQIVASLLAHKNANGIRIKLSLKTGNDKSILIPYGKIVAKYGDTPNDRADSCCEMKIKLKGELSS